MVISDYRKYFYGLKENPKRVFRWRVLEATGMSQASFYYKLRNGNWSKSERMVVDRIIEGASHAGEN